MKVFFYSSPASTKYDNFIHIAYDEIKKLGYDHLNDEIKTNAIRNVLTHNQFPDPAYIENVGGLMLNLIKADICVFDVSFQSLASGYLIDKSLEAGKPTIVLYTENIPHILSVLNDEKLIVKNYTDEKTLKKAVKTTLEQAREKRDKRFNFFLSPKLLTYLENTSNSQGVTKSKILRDLIVDHMRKNSSAIVED